MINAISPSGAAAQPSSAPSLAPRAVEPKRSRNSASNASLASNHFGLTSSENQKDNNSDEAMED